MQLATNNFYILCPEETALNTTPVEPASGPQPAPRAHGAEETAEVGRVEELFGSGEVLKALSLAGDLAKRYPANATNWNNLGVILNGLGKAAEARDCFRIAISIDGGFAEARNNLDLVEEKIRLDAFRVVAIIAAYNEGDVIRHSIGDLIRQGVEVYLLDNCSTDNTVEEASAWLGKGLIHIERFPDDAGYPEILREEFVLKEVLRRKEELATAIRADWFIHLDADEFRESPWPGLTLKEGIRVADSMGYNAIQFAVYNFKPTDDSFLPGADVREHLKYYLPLPENAQHRQVKAWKNLGVRPTLGETAGHEVLFEGRRIFPTRFILRHYPLRNQRQAARKVFDERKPRFSPAARKNGWHTQYDHIEAKDHNFIMDPAGLHLYDGNVARLQLLSYQTFLTSEAALGRETVDRLIRENWYDRRALHIERDLLKIW
jgi:glycosyltransferase involved in cell wall biosynthesis